MKIVLDTNVIIAALIARGVCFELLEHCALRHTLFTSDFILNETKEKLTDKFGYPVELADEAVAVLRSRMKLITRLPFRGKCAAMRMTIMFWRWR